MDLLHFHESVSIRFNIPLWGKAKVLRFPHSSINHTDNCRINPLHPNISMHILFTVLCTLPQLLTRRICLTIKSFFSWWSFPLFSSPLRVIQGWYFKEGYDASLGSKFNVRSLEKYQLFGCNVSYQISSEIFKWLYLYTGVKVVVLTLFYLTFFFLLLVNSRLSLFSTCSCWSLCRWTSPILGFFRFSLLVSPWVTVIESSPWVELSAGTRSSLWMASEDFEIKFCDKFWHSFYLPFVLISWLSSRYSS